MVGEEIYHLGSESHPKGSQEFSAHFRTFKFSAPGVGNTNEGSALFQNIFLEGVKTNYFEFNQGHFKMGAYTHCSLT